MKASLPKRELNRQRWYKLFTTWKQSNKNPRAFCQQHQLGLAAFQRWHRIFEDVVFSDDASRIRKGHAATIIRHPCMNLFQQEPSSLSLAKKRRKTA